MAMRIDDTDPIDRVTPARMIIPLLVMMALIFLIGKAIKDSLTRTTAARQALYKKQCALKRNRGNEERKNNA